MRQIIRSSKRRKKTINEIKRERRISSRDLCETAAGQPEAKCIQQMRTEEERPNECNAENEIITFLLRQMETLIG